MLVECMHLSSYRLDRIRLMARRLCSEYKGTGELKRKPLVRRRPRSEYHEYVPPRQNPPPPPKPADHYHKKPPFFILYGTPFQRKRDIIFVIGGACLTTTMAGIAYLLIGSYDALKRVIPGLESGTQDETEMFRVEKKIWFSQQMPRNPGQKFLTEDARELQHKQLFSVRPMKKGEDDREELDHYSD